MISRRYAAEQLAVVCQITEDSERLIIERDQRHGSLRLDFTRVDMLFVFWSTAMLVRHTVNAAPDSWRRSIGFLLDVLRAEAAHPLPVHPLTPDEVDDVMRRLGESGPI